MNPQHTLTQLNGLRLTGMAEQLQTQFDQPNTYDDLGFIERLSFSSSTKPPYETIAR